MATVECVIQWEKDGEWREWECLTSGECVARVKSVWIVERVFGGCGECIVCGECVERVESEESMVMVEAVESAKSVVSGESGWRVGGER